MRTTLKIILPLIVSVASVSLLFAAYQVRTEKSNLRNDLSRRAEILGESLQESVEPLLDRAPDRSLQRLVERFGQREHLKGVAVYGNAGAVLAITSGLPRGFEMRPTSATRAAQQDAGAGEFLSAEQTAVNHEEPHAPIHIYALPLHRNGEIAGTLALFHDTSYIDKEVSRTLRDSLLNAFVQTLLITGLALILVQWTFTGPLTRTAKWLRTLRTGQPNAPPAVSNGEILDEIHHEVKHLARDLDTARAAAEEEARLRVPPDRPSYTLRRVWLSDEEDKGYYEGFSNEGLWPLCHIAHTRPIFRPEDWLHYQKINRRFADVVLQEMESTESPILLAQDYHFALLPRMVKEARPDARVAIFWHIPWPNPEVFGICPWQRELVDGLLGADLMGFQIQSHCNNFLETVDRPVEALTEWDRFAVNLQGHVTRVRPYPISVAPQENGHSTRPHRSMSEEAAAICN